jgi:hypothetical protein
MMLFPLSGFPLADEYIRDSGLNVPWLRDGHVYFSTLADAGAFARQLGAENRAIELLKAMLLMAALQEKSHSQDFVLWSASQNPALSLLHSCLRAPAGDISSYAKAAHEPVLHAPDSLDRQLQYVLQHWNDISPATRARIHVILQYDFSAKLRRIFHLYHQLQYPDLSITVTMPAGCAVLSLWRATCLCGWRNCLANIAAR